MKTRGKTARDSTRYGTSRTSTRNFYVHHTQRIGLAAKQYDAKATRKSLCGRKQKLIGRAAGGAPYSPCTGKRHRALRPSTRPLNAVTRDSAAHSPLVWYSRVTHKLANWWSRRL